MTRGLKVLFAVLLSLSFPDAARAAQLNTGPLFFSTQSPTAFVCEISNIGTIAATARMIIYGVDGSVVADSKTTSIPALATRYVTSIDTGYGGPAFCRIFTADVTKVRANLQVVELNSSYQQTLVVSEAR